VAVNVHRNGSLSPPGATLRGVKALAIAVLLALTSCALGPTAVPEPSTPSTHEPSPVAAGDVGPVTRVVDGDTIHVTIDGARVKVRLIGIDTPETVHPRVPDQCFGAQASTEMHRLLDGERVRLVYDVDRLDRYDRTLAYVHRTRDDLFVNLHLVRNGFATVLTIPPNVAHADEFVTAQRAARTERRGLWRACAPFGG
jgi:micrococcal nuclease